MNMPSSTEAAIALPPQQVLAKWLALKVGSGHGGSTEEVEMLGATLVLAEDKLLKEIDFYWTWKTPIKEVFYNFALESDYGAEESVTLWQQIKAHPAAYKKLNKPRPVRDIKRWVEAARSSPTPLSDTGEVHQVSDDDERVPRLIKEYRLLKEVLGKKLQLNTLTKRIELDGESVSTERIKLDLAVDNSIYLKSSREDVHDFVCKLAEENAYSPVVRYLDQCHATHGNDTAILNGFADRYFGQSAPIYEAFIKRTLIAAVARAYQPGCQHDEVLVLQGKQGWYKSSFFRTLSNGWFDDSLGAIGDKDERLKLHQVWFVEWGELESVFRRKDIAATKSFLTCRFDNIRPPYGRNIQEMPRASVIVGSTNQEEFLSDPTGNRRFWIIPVVKPIPVQLLQEERDRIWAAAVSLYKSGERWDLSDGEKLDASAIAEEFQTLDPWDGILTPYLEGRDSVTTRELLEETLKIEPGRQDKASLMRVADILRERGWKRQTGWRNGKTQKIWVAPLTTPDIEVVRDSNGHQEGVLENHLTTPDIEVVRDSNGHQEGVLDGTLPPLPPPEQHLTENGRVKTSSNHPNFYQIGGLGGRGGKEVDREGVSDLTTSLPPQDQGGKEIKNREDVWK